MSTEIKIRYGEVEQALSRLKDSTQALDTSMPSNIGGKNVLEVINRLNELNGKMKVLLTAYKTLLQQNENSTQHSVQMMREADEKLAHSTNMHQRLESW